MSPSTLNLVDYYTALVVLATIAGVSGFSLGCVYGRRRPKL